ncbi:HNH endonuclease [Terrarubrum flagellatum]|uniref:HNH endonuclease signature motif containing protein n=1 Tax=Terrirubrum flagellatum TaxID=2895980 RepID=UPI0031455DE5
MRLGDVADGRGRMFARIEIAPAGSFWPALSVRSPARGWLHGVRPRHDLILYVGADDPRRVKERDDRGRLLSAVMIDSHIFAHTRDLVPFAAIEDERRRGAERLDYSVRFSRAWRFVERPLMSAAYPETFGTFVEPHKRGCVVEVSAADVSRLLTEPIESCPVPQAPREAVDRAPLMEDYSTDIARACRGAADRARRSGRLIVKRAARREKPESRPEMEQALRRIIVSQEGCCALCGGPVPANSENELLKLSIDRIDNSDLSYSLRNMQIAHLGCNRARGGGSSADWVSYVRMISDIPKAKRARTLAKLSQPNPS